MVALKWVIAIIGTLSFLTFVVFFGRLPQLRNTPISGLHRLITVHGPNAIWSLDDRLTGGRLTHSAKAMFNRMMYDRHPTVVIFFLSILVVAELLYLPPAWPRMSPFTKFTAAIAVAAPYVFLYLSCAADPGYITPENHAYHMSLYPYDYAIFHPGRMCSTCNMIKPPRSKHCSVCKKCIARADHHCIFINGCVGYGNHHYFLLLLFSVAVLTSYGALLGLSLLSSSIKANEPEWSLWPPAKMSWGDYGSNWAITMSANIRIGSATMLCTLMSPLVWGLMIYTMYLVYCGTSTNESLKWTEFKEDIEDGFAFWRQLPRNRPLGLGEVAWTRWPLRPERIMISTRDGQPPREDLGFPGEGEWERPPGMKEVENVYDLGLWRNLQDVFIDNPDFGDKSGLPTSERRRKPSRSGSSFPP